jgi:peptidyl-prolyl cis-trans isomerase A (cyclophilin A)
MRNKKNFVTPVFYHGHDDHDRFEKKEKFLLSWLRNNSRMISLIFLCLAASFLLARYASHLNPLGLHQITDSLHDVVREVDLRIEKSISNQKSDFVVMVKAEEIIQIPWPGCYTELPNPDYRPHIVKPPEGDIAIVCCNTTKGPITFDIHPSWAPQGAKRFLDMVKDDFFATEVPLFRALKGFLIQFGLAGDPAVHKRYQKLGNLPDDPPWLPLGPPGREINNITRYQKGYLSYAGAGKNSRGTQLILALENNKYLGGGSPWEVPIGQAFGSESFITLSKIYTKYGENPSQGKIMNRGKAYIYEEFPLLDFMTKCVIIKENVPWHYVWQER